MTRLTAQSEYLMELSEEQQEVVSGGKGLLDLGLGIDIDLDLDLDLGLGKKDYYGYDKKRYGYDKKRYH